MPFYTWKNKRTGEVKDIQRPMAESHIPPDYTDEWERVFGFGVGRVEGAGGSPARQAKTKK